MSPVRPPGTALAHDELTEAAVAAWLVDLLGDHLGALPHDQLLADAGWDSLTLAEVAIAAEAELGAVLPDELLAELRTVGDVVHYVQVTAGRATGGSTPSVALHPVTAADEPMLFEWLTDPDRLVRFRLRCVTPSPETFHRLLWDGVVCQYIACRHDGVPVGLVSCFEADHRNRFAHLAAVAAPGRDGTTLLPQALARFVDLLFGAFDLRKLYAEMLDGSYREVASGLGRLFRQEGVLREHEFVDGGYQDLHLLSVHRDDWQASRIRRCIASLPA